MGYGEDPVRTEDVLTAMEKAFRFLDEGARLRAYREARAATRDRLAMLYHVRELLAIYEGELGDRTPEAETSALLPPLAAAQKFLAGAIARAERAARGNLSHGSSMEGGSSNG